MTKIEVGKVYKTRNGRPVRVLCVDSGSLAYPVIALHEGGSAFHLTENGFFYNDGRQDCDDIVEHSPWSDVPVDAKIFVRDHEGDEWVARHFACYKDGGVYAWARGSTSFTTDEKISWAFVKLAEESAQ